MVFEIKFPLNLKKDNNNNEKVDTLDFDVRNLVALQLPDLLYWKGDLSTKINTVKINPMNPTIEKHS